MRRPRSITQYHVYVFIYFNFIFIIIILCVHIYTRQRFDLNFTGMCYLKIDILYYKEIS